MSTLHRRIWVSGVIPTCEVEKFAMTACPNFHLQPAWRRFSMSPPPFVDWQRTNQQATLKLDPQIGPSKDNVQSVTNPGNFQFGFRLNF
jgi:hypothetical protein